MADNLFDKVDEISQDVRDIKGQKTLRDQINEKDPVLIKFLETARLKWIWNDGKSDFRRKINRRKKNYIARICLLLIQTLSFAVLACFNIYAVIPLTISICVNCVHCFVIIKNLKMELKYEMDYNNLKFVGKYYDLDDNNIICASHERIWLITITVLTVVLSCIAPFMYMLFLNDGPSGIVSMIILTILAVITLMIFLNNHFIEYVLYFVDDKNKVEYFHFKKFIEENNIEINR